MNVQTRKYRIFACFFLASMCLALLGCSKRYHNLPAFSAFPIYDSVNHSVGRFKTSYLADQIHAYFRGSIRGPIGVATFVDLDNLYGSSTFGRMVGEQLMGELTMRGYNVVELRKADSLQVMFAQGEFGLSREVDTLRNWQELSAIVVGTYVASPVRVYLNARIIDPSSSMVLSAGSVEMQKTREIAKMLRGNTMPPTMERIPVRHLGYSLSPMPYYWPHAPFYGMFAPMPQPQRGGEEIYSPDPMAPSTAVPLEPSAEGEVLAPPEPTLEPTA